MKKLMKKLLFSLFILALSASYSLGENARVYCKVKDITVKQNLRKTAKKLAAGHLEAIYL